MEKGFHAPAHKKPWRYKTEDGLTVTRGAAWSGPGCHIGCGVLLYTDESGKLVKCEGDPENPFNRGRLCVRCLDVTESVYNKTRQLQPMKRLRENRGKDAWEKISWDEAYDLVSENFLRFREESGPESVAFFQGTGRDIAPWITRFAWSFGSPNNVFGMSGQSCYGPRVAGQMAVCGSFFVGDYSQQFVDRYDNPHWKCPEVIVVWGNNPLVTNSDGLYGHWVVDCMKRGAKLIVIDPRRIWLANRAELYLPVRPGTDAALALSIINVIIEEDLYDHEFVDCWCYGFNELAEVAKAWDPERAEEVCWCPADKIRAAARMIARADGAVNQWGVAPDMQKQATNAGHAITDIFAITGNIDNPGGNICPEYILMYFNGWGREFLDPAKRAARIGDDKYPMVANAYSKAMFDEVMKAIDTGEPHVMRGAWLQTVNTLVNSAPNPAFVVRAMRKLEFVAAIDLYMTPTIMELADVFLPVATFAERQGIRIGDGVQRAEAINRAVDQSVDGIDVRSDMQVNMELGKRFRPEAYPWDRVEDMFSAVFAETGKTFEEVREEGPIYIPFRYYKYKDGGLREDGQPGFNTATGRIELWSTYFSSLGLSPLPEMIEPVHSPYSTPDEYEEYPVVLTTGARNWSLFHSEHRQVPRLRAMHPNPIVRINSRLAERFSVRDGDWVWLRNQYGRCKRQIIVDEGMMDGVASADHGWWMPELGGSEEEGLFGAFEYNCNMLFKFNPGDSGFGCDYKCMLCTIDKCTAEEAGIVSTVHGEGIRRAVAEADWNNGPSNVDLSDSVANTV